MANIKDVANLALVSIASVSRYLKDPESVGTKIGARIKDSMEKLNYTPSIIAQSMRNQKTRNVCLIVEDITSPAYSEIVHGAEKCANEHNYNMVIINIKNKNKNTIYNDILSGRKYVGLVLSYYIVPEDEIFLIKLKEKKIPFVLNHSELFKDKYNSIVNNNYKGGYEGTKHLIEKGHKKIALLEINSFRDIVEARKKGYIDALSDHFIRYNPSFSYVTDLSIEGGMNIGKKILKDVKKYTAIFCLSDYIAIGLLKCFIKSKIKVPDEISLLGFDDIEWAKVITPSLSTVHQRKRKLGYLSMERIISFLESGETKNSSVVLDTYVVERETVKSV